MGYFNYQQGQLSNTTAGRSDQEIAKNLGLYNYEQPGAAFDNMLRSQGYNPYAANPFMQSIRTMAPGISNSYLMARAMNPNQGPGGNQGEDYRNYMSGVFNPASIGAPSSASGPVDTGAPGQGSQFYATLSDAARSMPQAIQAARNFNPQNATQINPYLGALNQRLAADGGQGATDMMMSFYGPQMSRGVRTAYGDALDMARSNAMNAYWNSPNLMNGDIYTYLFGI